MRPLSEVDPSRFETPRILKRVAAAARSLAELKGVAASIPNQAILISTLTLQEAKDSSAIENFVTTHDQLFRDEGAPASSANLAAKEVFRYRQALHAGFREVREKGLLTLNTILAIHAELECNSAGLRKVPGTSLKDGAGRIVYTPPQDATEVLALMRDLERFIHDDPPFEADPLVKMALLHHRFESIHPFYDGNGRTGRIVNVLYLVKEDLLDIPVLYLSRHIVRTKADYYRLLQAVRDDDAWEDWVDYMLTAVDKTARESVATIGKIRTLLSETKRLVRDRYRFYSQDLINNLFRHPYTKIEFLQNDLKVSRLTATRYLNELVEGGILAREKVGRTNYYINLPLFRLLTAMEDADPGLA